MLVARQHLLGRTLPCELLGALRASDTQPRPQRLVGCGPPSASASAATSSAGTSSAASSTTSGRLELLAVITGVPQAMASSGGRPKPS